jgi:hypothetical protein
MELIFSAIGVLKNKGFYGIVTIDRNRWVFALVNVPVEGRVEGALDKIKERFYPLSFYYD